jgi:hypothetical protein
MFRQPLAASNTSANWRNRRLFFQKSTFGGILSGSGPQSEQAVRPCECACQSNAPKYRLNRGATCPAAPLILKSSDLEASISSGAAAFFVEPTTFVRLTRNEKEGAKGRADAECGARRDRYVEST